MGNKQFKQLQTVLSQEIAVTYFSRLRASWCWVEWGGKRGLRGRGQRRLEIYMTYCLDVYAV